MFFIRKSDWQSDLQGDIERNTFSNRKSDWPSDLQCEIKGSELRILVPVQDYEQGRLAVSVLLNNRDDRIRHIRLFHCVEDRLVSSGFVHAFEIMQAAEEQSDKVEESQSHLERLAQTLTREFPDVHISFDTIIHRDVPDAIVKESLSAKTNMILFVTDPKRKKHWLVPSISNRVLRNAGCPVQIIKPAKVPTTNNQVFSTRCSDTSLAPTACLVCGN
ncbi:MAG: universal stress protein [Cyanobacteria bacterium]|nr:universal stress protein [Cyanobacteriota bacterium]